VEPTALVIEDNSEWLRILRDELLSAGFKIDWAMGREEALQKIAAPPFPYGMVVLDPNLGDSLGGIAGRNIAERLMGLELTPPIVLVSGYADRDALTEEYARFAPAIHEIFEKGRFDLERFRQVLLDLRGVEDTMDAFFRPDRAALEARWAAVLESREADDANGKGRALEQFSIELLSSIPLLEFVEHRASGVGGEIDAVFRVSAIPGTLCQEWGGHLLVECRNRIRKFDVPDVGVLMQRLATVQAKVAVVVSLAGVTGRSGTDARAQIRQAFSGQNRLVLVIDEEDIRNVLEAGANLYSMLERKEMDVRLGRV
jgi:CheY-like chemotaxis protein